MAVWRAAVGVVFGTGAGVEFCVAPGVVFFGFFMLVEWGLCVERWIGAQVVLEGTDEVGKGWNNTDLV